jgi:hypothetical protein
MAEIEIAFSGPRAVTGPLAAGQRMMWNCIQEIAPDDVHFNLSMAARVPAGTTLDEVLGVLSTIVTRHEALRTTYSVGHDGEPCQKIHRDGNLPVRLLHVEEADEESVIREFDRELMGDRFDLLSDWPIRLAVCFTGGAPCAVAVVVSHIVADAWSLQQLQAEIEEHLRRADTSGAHGGEPWQPYDQAMDERTAYAQRLQERSLSYARQQLMRFPVGMLALPPRVPESPPCWHGELESEPLVGAIDILCRRHGVTAASVVLAAYSLAFCRFTGYETCSMMINFANRSRRNADSVGMFMFNAPIRVPAADRSFGDTVIGAHQAALTAYRYALYDHDKFRAVLAETDRERGTAVNLFCGFSALPGLGISTTKGSGTQSYFRSRQVGSPPAVVWRKKDHDGYSAAYLRWRPPATIEFLANTRFFAPAQIELLLQAVWRIIIECSEEEAAIPAAILDAAGVRPPGRDKNWVFLDNSWIDLAEVRRLVMDTAKVDDVTLEVISDDEGTHSIRACLASCEPHSVSILSELPERCRANLNGRDSVMVPHEFKLL